MSFDEKEYTRYVILILSAIIPTTRYKIAELIQSKWLELLLQFQPTATFILS